MEGPTPLSSKKEKQELIAIQDFLLAYAPGTSVVPVKVPESNQIKLPDFVVPELGLAVEIKDAANKNVRKHSSAWVMTCQNLTKKLNSALLSSGITNKYYVHSQQPVIPINLHNSVIDRVLDAIRKGNTHISVLLKNDRYNRRTHVTIIELANKVGQSMFDSSLTSYGAFGASSFVQNLFFREADDQGFRGDSSVDSANKQLANVPNGFKVTKKILLVTVGSREYMFQLFAREIREAFAQYQDILLQSANIDEIWIRTEHYGNIEVHHIWSRVTL